MIYKEHKTQEVNQPILTTRLLHDHRLLLSIMDLAVLMIGFGHSADGQTPHIGTKENEDLLHSHRSNTHKYISGGISFQVAEG
ncbi:hypothetical protein GJ744_002760 [Endocarpon pusillum]|uniref:Uncharacterized protein n=1 Tax=Endocarpon pusillum TaxID=364733 RepID=A0A8H7ASA2_9EURO|nr:hypothetical protein GJ744_002760 [Endocarpon pusillum]